MPFIVPFLPMIAQAGMAAGGSLLANKLSKSKPSAMEQNVLSQNAEAQKLGLDTAKTNTNSAQNLISMGTSSYQPVLNYWSSILSGNKGAVTGSMAPEISRIGEGYKAASNTSAALNPRGGPSTSFLSELPFQQQRDVTSLLQTARPTAATNLFQTGQGVAQTGTNLFSNATNALYGSTAAGRDILNSEQERKRLEAERGKAIGGGLFDLIQKYGFPALDGILKGGGGNIRNIPNLGGFSPQVQEILKKPAPTILMPIPGGL